MNYYDVEVVGLHGLEVPTSIEVTAEAEPNNTSLQDLISSGLSKLVKEEQVSKVTHVQITFENVVCDCRNNSKLKWQNKKQGYLIE